MSRKLLKQKNALLFCSVLFYTSNSKGSISVKPQDFRVILNEVF